MKTHSVVLLWSLQTHNGATEWSTTVKWIWHFSHVEKGWLGKILNDFFRTIVASPHKWDESRRGLTRPYFSFIHSSKRKERPPPPLSTDWERESEFESEGVRKAGILIDAFWKEVSAAGVPTSKVLQHFHVLRSARFLSLGEKRERERRRGISQEKALELKQHSSLIYNSFLEMKKRKIRRGVWEKSERGSKKWRTGERQWERNGRVRFLLFRTFWGFDQKSERWKMGNLGAPPSESRQKGEGGGGEDRGSGPLTAWERSTNAVKLSPASGLWSPMEKSMDYDQVGIWDGLLMRKVRKMGGDGAEGKCMGDLTRWSQNEWWCW